MTTKPETDVPLKAGDQIHWVGTRAMTAYTSENGTGPGAVLSRGMTITVSSTFLRLNESWLRLSESEQIEKHGEVRWKRGPWPEGQIATLPGNRDHWEDRSAAREAAWRETNPDDRALALRRVEEVYGPAPSTSTQIASYAGGR